MARSVDLDHLKFETSAGWAMLIHHPPGGITCGARHGAGSSHHAGATTGLNPAMGRSAIFEWLLLVVRPILSRMKKARRGGGMFGKLPVSSGWGVACAISKIRQRPIAR